jgi:uncharacterized protein (TIGR02271 family)
MDTNYDQIQAGWSAHGSDGDKIGDIEEVGQNYLLVTKGLIFPKDLYIPQSAIRDVDTDQGQVFLNVEKSQVDDMGWNEPPAAGDWAAGGVAGGGSAVMNNDVTTGDTTGAVDRGGYATDYGTTTETTDDYATTTTTGTTGYASGGTDYGTETSGDTLRVPVRQEELRAERRSESAGEVRVDKDIVEEQRTLDVPVTREEVEIRRVPVDSTATADDTAFTSGETIRVPVTAEQVQVTKEARVVEEIEISKRPVTETQTITDTVRREQVNVDETGGVLGGTGTTRGTAGNEAYVGSSSTGVRDTGYTGDAGYTGDDRGDRGDRGGGREVGAEAAGAGGGALGGAAIGGVVGGPPGAVIGGVIGAAGGALAGESAEGGDEKGGAAAGGGAGAVAGAVVGGAVAGPPGAVVGGAVGAGAGSGIGDQAQEGDDDETTRR